MGLLNSLVYFLRRNWLIFTFLFVGAFALGQAFYDQLNVDNLRLDGNTISSQNTNGDINLDPNGTGGVAFPDLTASTVPYLDANKELTSSSVTPTELGYLSGVTSAIQTQIDGLATGTLTDSYIFVGNASNEATGVAVSGDIAMANDGTVSISSGVITNADVNASAGIEMSKLEALTASRVPVLDGSGFLSASSVTATTLGYLDATSSIQTQLDAKLDDFTGSADNLLLRTDGASGNAIQESGITVDDSDNISGINTLIVEGLTATPSTPSAGTLAIYAKDDNNVYKLNSSGVETEIGAGGGGSGTGSINYFQDYQADDQGTYVAEFDDSSAIVDGTGGTASNLSQSSETTNPLSGSTSYKLTKAAANASFEGWSMDTDTPDRTSTVGGETVYITFNYETSANYNNSGSGEQVSIYVYRVGSNTLEACNTRDVLSGTFTNALPVAPDGGQYQCVTTLESTDTAVRVIFGITGTGTSTWDLVVDKIKVGPDAVVTAPIVTEWQEFDMVITGSVSNPTKATSPTADSAYWRRVGDSMEIQYLYRNPDPATGSAAGSGVYRFNLPSGYTIDTDKLDVANSGGLNTVGSASAYIGSGGINAAGTAVVAGAGSLQLNIGDNTQGMSVVSSTYFPLTNATLYLTFRATVPIVEFANSNAILSTTQADHQTVTAKYKGDPASTTANNPIIAPTLVEDDFSAYSTSTGLFTSPSGGKIKIYGVVVSACTGGIALNGYKNGSSADTPLGYLDSNGEATFVGYIEDVSAGDTVSVRPSSTCDFQAIRLQFEHIPLIGSTFSTYGPYDFDNFTSSVKTPSGTGHYHQLTGNSYSIGPGTWDFWGSVFFNSSGGSAGYTNQGVGFFGANGGDSSSTPAGIGTLPGCSINSAYGGGIDLIPYMDLTANNFINAARVRVTCTQSATIYMVTYSNQSTSANARVTVFGNVERIK